MVDIEDIHFIHGEEKRKIFFPWWISKISILSMEKKKGKYFFHGGYRRYPFYPWRDIIIFYSILGEYRRYPFFDMVDIEDIQEKYFYISLHGSIWENIGESRRFRGYRYIFFKYFSGYPMDKNQQNARISKIEEIFKYFLGDSMGEIGIYPISYMENKENIEDLL